MKKIAIILAALTLIGCSTPTDDEDVWTPSYTPTTNQPSNPSTPTTTSTTRPWDLLTAEQQQEILDRGTYLIQCNNQLAAERSALIAERDDIIAHIRQGVPMGQRNGYYYKGYWISPFSLTQSQLAAVISNVKSNYSGRILSKETEINQNKAELQKILDTYDNLYITQ